MSTLSTNPVYNLVRFSFRSLPNSTRKFVGILDMRENKIHSFRDKVLTEDILFDGDPVTNVEREIANNSPKEFPLEKVILHKPMTKPSVWGAGVTYENSKFMREAESGQPGFYARVYTAERPELFDKGKTGDTTSSGSEETLFIPRKSDMTLTEAELVFVISPDRKIVGYTIGNDFTATDIEAQNPLYLPQAKIFKGCFGFGPSVVIGMSEEEMREQEIKVTVIREDGTNAFSAQTSIGKMKRTFTELVDWLFDDGREEIFNNGVLLSSGTGVVMKETDPDENTIGSKIPHKHGDTVSIEVLAIGKLVNKVQKMI